MYDMILLVCKPLLLTWSLAISGWPQHCPQQLVPSRDLQEPAHGKQQAPADCPPQISLLYSCVVGCAGRHQPPSTLQCCCHTGGQLGRSLALVTLMLGDWQLVMSMVYERLMDAL
jgi:hypothetical protein